MVANVDFLPERTRVGRARRRRLVRQAYLLAMCLVGLAALAQLRQGRIGEARGELGLLEERCDQVQNQIVLRAELEAEQAGLLVKKRIDENLGSRVNAIDILGELQQLSSDRLTLTSMTIHAADIPVPTSTIAGGLQVAGASGDGGQQVNRRIRLVLTGLAPSDIDVANFIGQLASSPLFEDVNMGYAKTIYYEDHEAREFQASCFIVR